jgi:RNA polymerase sigma-70 factor (ECF subfamily)
VRATNHQAIDPKSAAPPAHNNPVTCEEPLEQELVRLHNEQAAGLFRYAVSLTQDCGHAQDAVQEVFLRYFVARTEGQRFSNAKAWLFRVLRNLLIDVNRASQRRFEVDIDEVRESPDRRQDLDTHLHDRETLRQLSAALAPRELECVRLRAEGLHYDEIADVLAVRSGTVGALLTRAHAKIRRYLHKVGYVRECDNLMNAAEPEGSPYAP